MSKSDFDSIVAKGPFASFTVVATAAGLGPDWAEMRKPPEGEVSLHLVEDTVAIEGRIVDLQGKPVAVKISRGRIQAEGPEGIAPYLTLVREDPFKASNHNFAKNYWAPLPGNGASLID